MPEGGLPGLKFAWRNSWLQSDRAQVFISDSAGWDQRPGIGLCSANNSAEAGLFPASRLTAGPFAVRIFADPVIGIGKALVIGDRLKLPMVAATILGAVLCFGLRLIVIRHAAAPRPSA
jgi:hypothetical protein